MATVDSLYEPGPGSFFGAKFWQIPNGVEATLDYVARTNTDSRADQVSRVFEMQGARPGAENFINDKYDDEGWWAIAWIKAFDATGDARYLNMARSIAEDIKTGWSDDVCGGGLFWDKERTYKNAIPNELFVVVTARLHARVDGDAGPGSYLDWAERTWHWLDGSGMIGSDSLIDDGLDPQCKPVPPQVWTYNQGVILGGLVELSKATGDTSLLDRAERIADAAMSHLVDADGILHEKCEPSCGEDGEIFKGIFVRYLAQLDAVRPRAANQDFLQRNADSLWTRSHSTTENPHTDLFGLSWAGPFGAADAPTEIAALDLFNAALGPPPGAK
jgi:predicted alpha-1,6-mannanase (GH76 family)